MSQLDTMKIALGQMEVLAGKPSENFQTMSSMIADAKDQGAHLIVFPEMCLGGHYLEDKWMDASFVDHLVSFNDRVKALSDGIGIIFGNAVKDPESGRLYNAALFAQDGNWVETAGDNVIPGASIKMIPEQASGPDRYFASVPHCAQAPFNFAFGEQEARVCLAVADAAASTSLAAHCAGKCDLLVTIASTPWTYDAMPCNALVGTIPQIHVNAVGMQNTSKNVFSFDGGSKLVSTDGIVTACNDKFDEELLVASFGERSKHEPYAKQIEKTTDALIKTLRRFDQQVFPFKPKWVLGLSGGIDSSVTCALLGMALEDHNRIVGYNLATRYNSDATKMNAYNEAQALGIRLVNGSIEDVIAGTNSVLKLYGYDEETISGLTQENIQARLRGHMLSTFAAIEGGVIMNNGNKIECALGYATLYGDAVGAIGPIADITKVRLFEVAKELNKRYGCEVVPENLIPEETEDGFIWETMPSAELRDAQLDPMKWFYHDWLIEELLSADGMNVEQVMEQYLADKLASTPAGKWIKFWGLDDPKAFIDDIEWVQRQIQGTVYKRIQTPPIFKFSHGPSGLEARENQVAYENSDRYNQLRQRILAK